MPTKCPLGPKPPQRGGLSPRNTASALGVSATSLTAYGAVYGPAY